MTTFLPGRYPSMLTSRCRTESRDIQSAPASFPAPHCQDQRLALQKEKPVRFIDRGYFFHPVLSGTDGHNHRIALIRNLPLHKEVYVALCVFRSGQLLLERMKTEAVVNALVQNPA